MRTIARSAWDRQTEALLNHLDGFLRIEWLSQNDRIPQVQIKLTENELTQSDVFTSHK